VNHQLGRDAERHRSVRRSAMSWKVNGSGRAGVVVPPITPPSRSISGAAIAIARFACQLINGFFSGSFLDYIQAYILTPMFSLAVFSDV